MNWLSNQVVDHLRVVVELPDLSHTKYNCIHKIGAGGMATVYLAEDTELQRRVALKVLNLPDKKGDLAKRMQREARIIASLEHSNIVPIHDVGSLRDGRVFYVMKYVDGQTLNERIEAGASLPELLRIFQKVCDGVAFAHAQQVLHRDLKPENIMIRGFGEVLVMDWGLAKLLFAGNDAAAPESERPGEGQPRQQGLVSDAHTEHGAILGTPAYMAPEQQTGDIAQIDQRTDVFALGAILNFILNRVASGAENPSTSNPKKSGSVKRSRLPKPLKAIARKAMSGDKYQRYADAAELLKEIVRYLDGAPVSAYQENPLEAVWRWLKKNNFLMILILAYALTKLLTLFLSRL